ncbi:hypothetical protein Drorol1_Dr00018817 [Drosera rotundifolia]
MGTKLEFDNSLPGYSSMSDFARGANGGSWPVYYGDNGFPNGQHYYGLLPKSISDSYQGHGKDIVKRTILEHEMIFKNQVYELHRLYKVQKDIMDEFKRKEGSMLQTPFSTSTSSSKTPSEATTKLNASSFPLGNSVSSKPHLSALGIVQAPVNENNGRTLLFGSPVFSSIQKDPETSDSRPTKQRRIMLDLELPANEYIDGDEVEQCGETPGPCATNPKSASDNGTKLFLNHLQKIDCNENGITSDSLPKGSKILADLNQPVVVEEPTLFPSVDFSSTSMPRDGCSGACFLGLPRENLPDSWHRSINGISNVEHLESKGNGGSWLSYILGADQSREKLMPAGPVHQSVQVGKAPGPLQQPKQFLLESTQHTPGFHPFHHSKGDPWRTTASGERNYFRLDHDDSKSFVHAEGPIPSSYTYSSGWFNSSSSLFKGLPSSNNGPNLDFGREMPVRNGFIHGPLSGSTDPAGRIHLGNVDLLSRVNGVKRDHGSGDFFGTSSSHAGLSSNKDQYLNPVLSNGFPSYLSDHQFSKFAGGSAELGYFHPSLPWVTGNGACSKEAASPVTALNSMEWCSNNDLKKSLDHLNSLDLNSDNGTRIDASDSRSGRMILGIPIFDNPLVSKRAAASSAGGPSCVPRPSQGQEIVKTGFDINLPCDPMDSEIDRTYSQEAVSEEKKGTGGAGLRGLIDLNSFATEDDVPPVRTNMKRGFEIDLEAPVGPEIEDGDDRVGKELSTMSHNLPLESHEHSTEDVAVLAELARTAAATIVDISASVIQDHAVDPRMNDSSENPLHGFVDAISSSIGVPLELSDAYSSKNQLDAAQDDCLSNDSGYFESMTLKLTECDVEKYLSKPSEVSNAKATGTHVSGGRARRGQARRGGRQRRDFQRDILPGLVSLSRHEVTEDIQTFGGLMRATGHIWHSSPRRNGSVRGRRRLVATPVIPRESDTVCALLKPQLADVATNQVRHEDTSLIGWGKRTRRPRRLRFPAGSPAAATL